MKYLILLVIVIALATGYYMIVNQGQQQTVQQQAQRETQIMTQQKQLMDQSRNLGRQMQQDLDKRMQGSEQRDLGQGQQPAQPQDQ